MRIEVRIELARDLSPLYLLHPILDAWRAAGHDVATRRIGEPPPCAPDRVLVHVDRSRVPRAWLAGPDACPVLNGRAHDIGKRRVSRQLLARPEPDAGPVLVKTELNYHGIPERHRLRDAPWPRRLAAALGASLRHREQRALGRRRYPIFEDATQVPGWVWRSRRYVVERFLPERDGSFYVLRNWIFLGDRERSLVSWSREPIVKSGNIERFEDAAPPPAALRERRRELGLDYGKIDWVMHDGEPVLLDANKTPTARRRTPGVEALAAQLAPGIEAFA